MAPFAFDPLGPWEWSPYAPLVARLRHYGLIETIRKIQARRSFVADRNLDAALAAFDRARPDSQDERDAIDAIRALETAQPHMRELARERPAQPPRRDLEKPIRKRTKKATEAKREKASRKIDARREALRALVGRDPSLSPKELSWRLGVSEDTVARDLRWLRPEKISRTT